MQADLELPCPHIALNSAMKVGLLRLLQASPDACAQVGHDSEEGTSGVLIEQVVDNGVDDVIDIVESI